MKRGAGPDFLERTKGDFFAAMKDQYLVAEGFDQHQEMRRKQKRGPGFGPTADGRFDVPNPARVEAGERFVQDDDAWLAQKGARERKFLQHSSRETRRNLMTLVGQAEFFEEFGISGLRVLNAVCERHEI